MSARPTGGGFAAAVLSGCFGALAWMTALVAALLVVLAGKRALVEGAPGMPVLAGATAFAAFALACRFLARRVEAAGPSAPPPRTAP